ncbi:MAG: hydroxymethylpyrimidine/phosphomethylpyrimidine kinase [Planctomycetota bacterium]|jgi:hydroxymethylpyrimidine/phosphomethylpyrimidine kinase
MITALSIAGSDPTGAAGMEVDLRVFQALKLHGCAVATALTAQDSNRVHDVYVLPAPFIGSRLRVLLNDLSPDVVKCGMLADEHIAQLVVSLFQGPLRGVPFVLDPVILSSSGAALLTQEALVVMREHLLPVATVITPNRAEAIELLEHPSDSSSEALAKGLNALGPSVILTGGDEDEPSATDHVCINGEVTVLEAQRFGLSSPHGTGCTLSSAIAAYLALGESPLEAITKAKVFTNAAIQKAERFGKLDGKLFCRF